MTQHYEEYWREWLFRDFERVQTYHMQSFDLYSKWEGWYLVAEGMLLVATSNLVRSSINSMTFEFAAVLALTGLLVSFSLMLVQRRGERTSSTRLNRLLELELALRKPVPIGNAPIEFMNLIEDEDKERKEDARRYMAGWPLRRLVPIAFIILWAVILVGSILLTANPSVAETIFLGLCESGGGR